MESVFGFSPSPNVIFNPTCTDVAMHPHALIVHVHHNVLVGLLPLPRGCCLEQDRGRGHGQLEALPSHGLDEDSEGQLTSGSNLQGRYRHSRGNKSQCEVDFGEFCGVSTTFSVPSPFTGDWLPPPKSPLNRGEVVQQQ
jgi:hypothetical protein